MNEKEALKHVLRLCPKLDSQAKRIGKLERYYNGDHPIPQEVIDNKVTESYKKLLSMAQSNWPELVVDSVEERLEVQAISFTTKAASEEAWNIWQANGLDADAGMAHQAALIGGRAYAIVWLENDEPTITLDHGSCVYVEYVDGSQRNVGRAIRRWTDGTRFYVTLYDASGTYKFQAKTESSNPPSGQSSWERRTVPGEDWPLPARNGKPPVFEIAVNRSLSTDHAKRARGEFESALAMIDRLNYTMFSLLAAMTWSGFPLRVLTGQPIDFKERKDENGDPVLDDDGEPVVDIKPPFDVANDRVVQFDSENAKLQQFQEAQLTNYLKTIEMEVKHFAAVTKTPAHYLLGEMVNLSADAIRAAEAGLISKVHRHQRSLGEGWEAVLRYALDLKGVEGGDDAKVEIKWRDPESRSLAERADAASKLAPYLPWTAWAEFVLQASPSQIEKWKQDKMAEDLLSAVAPAKETPPALPASTA